MRGGSSGGGESEKYNIGRHLKDCSLRMFLKCPGFVLVARSLV